MKYFFTESDFCDEGGYWKSRDYVLRKANERVIKLVAAVDKVIRQDDESGYPTTAEWHAIQKAAREAFGGTGHT